MNKIEIHSKIQEVLNETQLNGNSKDRIANLFTLVNLDNISLEISHRPDIYKITDIWNWSYNEPDYPQFDSGNPPVSVICKKNQLLYQVKDYKLIKDYEPTLILERYKYSRNRSGNKISPSGFKKITNYPNYLPFEFLITSENIEVLDFAQENYFRAENIEPLNQNLVVRAKGKDYSRKNSKSFFCLKIQLKIEGVIHLSKPLQVFGVVASVQRKGITTTPVQVPEGEKYISISYTKN